MICIFLQNTKHSKLEKADILELTVRHLQRQKVLSSDVRDKYRAGFQECAREVRLLFIINPLKIKSFDLHHVVYFELYFNLIKLLGYKIFGVPRTAYVQYWNWNTSFCWFHSYRASCKTTPVKTLRYMFIRN